MQQLYRLVVRDDAVLWCVCQEATCSHVGVPNMAAELAVSSSHNVIHIAETWFSRRKQLIYRIRRLNDSHNTAADHSAAAAADNRLGSVTVCSITII